MKRQVSIALLLAALAAAACTHIGPQMIPRDRFDYSTAIADSWKRQTLLNVVKLRYLDLPIFVDVGQIVSGYSLVTSLGAIGSLSDEALVPPGNSLALSGQARFEDRPTITYTPLTGSRFVRGLMTPLPPDSVFFTIQSGWAADAVLSVAATSLNGLKNQTVSAAGVAPADAGFQRALELLRKIQLSGAVGMRVVQDADKRQTSLVTFRTKDISQETLDQIAELRQLLHLDPEAQELKLVYSAVPADDKELAVLTNSMLHIMMALSACVDVPAADVEQGRATPGQESLGEAERTSSFRVRCAAERPSDDAFAAVEYRKLWFWIDDRDIRSKRALALLMLLFTLTDTGEPESLPLITIPAQ